MQLRPLNRRSENVRVLPVIVSELELGNIKRHVFAAYLMIGADDAALDQKRSIVWV